MSIVVVSVCAALLAGLPGTASAHAAPAGGPRSAVGSARSARTASAAAAAPSPGGQWALVGDLTTARAGATATALPSGEVVVAGGRDGSGHALASAELFDPTTGTWSATGSMSVARADAAATVVPLNAIADGVLVVGGRDASGTVLASAELFDPTSGTWSATGSLATARALHTATLLHALHSPPSLLEGEVLVAGGQDGSGQALASAELFDPAHGTWSATGSLATARVQHSATPLQDGEVLVAGGSDGSAVLASAERYDPAHGTWSATGSMATARALHSAPSLQDGEVLAAGGQDGSGQALASAELFDPTTGTWSPAASMDVARANAAATFMSGGPLAGDVLMAGGQDAGTTFASAEVFYPASGAWTRTAQMPEPIQDQAATVLPDGDVLLAGGFSNPGGSEAPLLFDPSTGAWSTAQRMLAPHIDTTATLLPSGKVLVAGGGVGGLRCGQDCLKEAELYDPTTGRWSTTGFMTTGRDQPTATLLPNGKVLVAGGADSVFTLFGHIVNSAELYDPASGTWTPTGSLSTTRIDDTATLLPNGKVLVAGGIDTDLNVLASAELYDPASGIWSPTGSLSTPREFHTATLLPNGEVLVVGGASDPTAELYDPASGTWTPTGSLSMPRAVHTATLLPNGTVLVTGGLGGHIPFALASAELYDPASGTWSLAATMSAARAEHSATLLPNGQVLVAGGVPTNTNVPSLDSAEVFSFSPQLHLPGTITVDATSPQGAAVSYAATASDPNPSPPTALAVTCTRASGSTFPIGTTRVVCRADEPGPALRASVGSFQVVVKGAAAQVDDLIASVDGFHLSPPGIPTSLDSQLQAVLADLAANNTAQACTDLASFISHVNAQSGKLLTTAQANALLAAAEQVQAVVPC